MHLESIFYNYRYMLLIFDHVLMNSLEISRRIIGSKGMDIFKALIYFSQLVYRKFVLTGHPSHEEKRCLSTGRKQIFPPGHISHLPSISLEFVPFINSSHTRLDFPFTSAFKHGSGAHIWALLMLHTLIYSMVSSQV